MAEPNTEDRGLPGREGDAVAAEADRPGEGAVRAQQSIHAAILLFHLTGEYENTFLLVAAEGDAVAGVQFVSAD